MNIKTILGVIALFAASSLSAEEIVIADGGKAKFVIAVPDDARESEKVACAAKTLEEFLEKSTGADFKVVQEGKTGGVPAIYLGKTSKGIAAGVPYAKLHDYVMYRKAVGGNVFIAGNDESSGVKGPLQYHDREYLCQKIGLNADVKDMTYRRWHGTLRSVLGFLEDACVVEILIPGENGTNIIRHDRLLVGEKALCGLTSWAFDYSNGRCYGNLVASTALGHVQIPHYKTWGGHTMPVAVPRRKYEKTHPEYFIMKDGVRRPDYGPANGGHHCVSNPDVLRLVVEELKRQYKFGYRWIQFGPTDGQVPCECDECVKMHPDPKERQWIFSRAVAERARDEIPDAKIVILAYVFTRWAPRSFDTFPDNVILELTLYRSSEEILNDWKRFSDVPKLAYTYFFGDYHSWAFAPTCSPKYLEKHMRQMKESNISAIFKCGFIQDPGLEGPIAWVYSQLLKDPYQDADKLAETFCEKAYGKGAEPMKRFFKLMYLDLMTPMGHSVIDEMRKNPHAPAQMFNYAFRPPILKSMGRLLSSAEAAVKNDDPKVRARLALVRRGYDFLRIRSECYNLQDAWALFGSREVLEAAEKVYDRRDAMLDAWYDSDGKMKKDEGFEWPYLFNRPREIIIRGGGQIVPSFPDLFRVGKGNVKELLGKKSFPLVNSEYWEGYRESGRRVLLGQGLEDLEKDLAKYKGKICDMKNVYKSIVAFRDKHRDFLVEGSIVGELKPIDPVEDAFGVFWRNRKGETALFVCATAPQKQKLRFRFPGSSKIETRELDLCKIHVFR